MTPAMDRETKNCPCCNGRGYLRCDCWPGDCICGWDDEDCENCNGDGIAWADEDEWPAGLADAEGGET